MIRRSVHEERYEKYPEGRLCTHAKRRAKQKNLGYELDPFWVRERIDTGRCEVTNIPFEIKVGSPWMPSIDRIDSSKGYTKENSRLVVWAFNRARGTFSDDVMLRLARAIVASHPY